MFRRLVYPQIVDWLGKLGTLAPVSLSLTCATVSGWIGGFTPLG